ncbi:helicase-associated domain-containing protein [Paenibacillus sp. N3.4]|uniref:helicase-associated domain-containing protein n=1 Tax=Paenibacillus sp. N3.4 TaxID=2603222 RepID=UPI0011C6FEE3|nr:helicase-associated domain-containing protein [Paenibacillus sp. N3.4]TXK85707.1 hypothetical protein FU659_01970 [Paenibacillus sp. N3.4]
MRYEQIDRKIPSALKKLIMGQSWCASLIEQGVEFPGLLTDQEYLSSLERHLSAIEKQTLRLILSSFGCEPFTSEILEKQAALRLSGSQVALGLVGLRRYGVIAAFRKAWGDQLYALPEDGFASWQRLLFPEVKLRTKEASIELEQLEAVDQVGWEWQVLVANPRGLAQQVFHFVAACSQQSTLPLTNKGTLHKKQLQKLMEHVSLRREVLQACGLSHAYRDVYEEPAAILLEMTIRLGILQTQADRYVLNEQACLGWMKGSYDRQQGVLYRIWRQLLTPAPLWLEHGLALLERAIQGQWCDLSIIIIQGVRSCCSLGGHGAEDDVIRRTLMDALIIPLAIFRFVELSKDQEGTLWFRWLISPLEANLSVDDRSSEDFLILQKEHSLYVQPDFDILLPPQVPLRVEWEIAAFADLLSTDLVRTYRLKSESFHRAWEKGVSSEMIISLLQEHACYEVPEHIMKALRQWGEHAGNVHFQEVTLLRCCSEEMAEALLRNEKCRSLLGERVGSSDFIIFSEHLTSLAKCLEGMGYHTGNNGDRKNMKASVSASLPTDQPMGLFYSRDTVRLYEMEPILPECDNLYPEMQMIPPLWLKEFRDYHGTTRKELIRKAIEWKSYLQLRQEGRDRFIIPSVLREDRTGFTLVGFEAQQEISLTGEDFSEMKLILPGINDEGLPC